MRNYNDSLRVDMAIGLLEHMAKSDKGVAPLNLLHLTDFDHQQHVNGVFSNIAKLTLEQEDTLLGRYVDAIHRVVGDATILVVSDHGFLNHSTVISPGGLFYYYLFT